MKSYLPAFLWISWDIIMIQAPSIPHFKDFGMRNLQYEMRICQKIHNKVTMQCEVFANFVNFLKSMKSYLLAFLWKSLDTIIVRTPTISHFKGLGMRNLQYEISIYQKINNKATMPMSSYLDFCWITRYLLFVSKSGLHSRVGL